MAADRLSIGVELTIGNDVFTCAGGNVSACELQLRPWGLTGSVTFRVWSDLKDDALLDRFVTQDRTDVRLTIAGAMPVIETAPDPLVVRAVATDKAVFEASYVAVDETPVLARDYTVTFADAAQVLWRQHYPLLLRADTNPADVLGEQAVGGISQSIDVGDASIARHLVCLPLDASRGVSYYDFLVAYLDRVGAHLLHDYATGGVKLVDRKPSGGKAVLVRGPDVAATRVRFPATTRHSGQVRNGAADHAATVPVPQDQAVLGIKDEHLLITPLTGDVADRVLRETTRLRRRAPELVVDYTRWPTVPFWPGQAIGLAKPYISAELWATGKAFRVVSLDLRATTQASLGERDRDTPSRAYDMDLQSTWEVAADPHAHLPPHAGQAAPLLVEGKVICDGGEAGDRPYAVHEDADTGEWYYKVFVPLWNQKIRAPFRPAFLRGHFYAPLYKDERVLLSLGFDAAEIVRTLDWGKDVQLPLESQGNRILFGKNATSETALDHVYTDDKPVFSVRRTLGQDKQVLQMEEGTLFMEVCEDESLAEASATVDLTPEVSASKEELSGATSGAIGGIGGAFAGAKGELTGKLEESKTSVGGAVEALSGELSGVAGTAKAELQGALGAMADEVGALGAAATAAISELRAQMTL